jgi:hypothetical protein
MDLNGCDKAQPSGGETVKPPPAGSSIARKLSSSRPIRVRNFTDPSPGKDARGPDGSCFERSKPEAPTVRAVRSNRVFRKVLKNKMVFTYRAICKKRIYLKRFFENSIFRQPIILSIVGRPPPHKRAYMKRNSGQAKRQLPLEQRFYGAFDDN